MLLTVPTAPPRRPRHVGGRHHLSGAKRRRGYTYHAPGWHGLATAASIAAVSADGVCSPSMSVDEAKVAATVCSGGGAAADACLGVALAALTSGSNALRSGRQPAHVPRGAPAAPEGRKTNGCIVDEAVCHWLVGRHRPGRPSRDGAAVD